MNLLFVMIKQLLSGGLVQPYSPENLIFLEPCNVREYAFEYRACVKLKAHRKLWPQK